jgi:dienelactone hydrolase
MNWQTDDFLRALYDQTVQQHCFRAQTREDWTAWHKALRQSFITDLGLAGLPRTADKPGDTLLEEVACEGYIRRRISLELSPELSVPIYLLSPTGSTGLQATVIACHGHGYGSRDLVGLKPDGTAKDAEPGYQMDFALELVRRGFLVVVPELVGFGDVRLAEDGKSLMEYSSCQRMASNLLMLGHTLAGVRVWQIRAILDWLCSNEAVDPERIGCMGISGGGLVCAFAAALDSRIRVAVVSGYANTFLGSVMAMHHCIDNFIPDLLRHAEMPDIIGLIAPRPLFAESGSEDPIFPVASTREAIGRIAAVYHLLAADDQFDFEIFPGAHRIWGEKAYPWLQKWLQA